MKTFILTLLFQITLISTTYTQSWHVEIPNDLESGISNSAVETSNGDFIFIGTQGGQTVDVETLRSRDLNFIKLSSDGDILINYKYEVPEPYKVSPVVRLSDVHPEDDIFMFTCVLNDQNTGERYSGIYKIDADLNILWDTIVGEVGDFTTINQHLLLNDTTLLFWGVNYSVTSNNLPFLMTMDLGGEISDWKFYPEIGQNSDVSAYLVDVGDKYIFNSLLQQKSCFINKETLDATPVYDFSFGDYLIGGPDFISWRHSMLPISDSEYVISTSGETIINTNPLEYKSNLGFCIMDSDNNIDTCHIFYEENTEVEFLLSDSNMTYANGYVYLVYYDGQSFLPYTHNIEWFAVVKYDLDGNLIWKSYVDFIDANFAPIGINTSTDGGVILSGYRFHPDEGEVDGHRNSVVIKIDENGELVGTSDPYVRLVKIPVYPNPVVDKLYFKTSEKDLLINVYDLQGKLLISEGLQNSEINLASLPANMYSYTIMQNSILIDSGKFIKE